ncbi:DUF4276 family protein [Trichlorobacter lovleyi]|uniref:DUF4276 family protein n=1 Tax=Trichlorobacter lovleyi TaxID=313985 RepID=UPI0024807371|nr:DUF4276 family protein [Trichlorobacter lovleyi]
MHYLGLALYAEGPTDYSFLRPLLQRLCEDICMQESTQPVEVSEVNPLNHHISINDAPREQRILEAAKDARGSWNLLFVHADGAGDSVRARTQQVQPAIDLLQQELSREGTGVAVIPIRETEAWAICDGDALRQVFGTTLNDEQMELPRLPSLVESDLDPKETLRKAFLHTTPSGRHRKQGVSPMLNALGEQVSLQQLRRLTAFAVLEHELKQALRQLRILA